MGMRFPKLKLTGVLKAPTGLLPSEDAIKPPAPIKPLPSEVSKFTGLKRSLAREKNIGNKFKI
jgi:hypothetical protein